MLSDPFRRAGQTVLGRIVRNPARLVVVAFVVFVGIGTLLLRLPIALDSGPHPGMSHALFTATSAGTVTGLSTVDVERWSLFGELVLLGLIQIGGFGIMTIGSVLGLVASQRIGLRQRIRARAEIGAIDVGELKTLIKAMAKVTLAVEAAVFVVLFLRWWLTDVEGPRRAAYSALFHAVSAFNNAGISLQSDSFVPFAGDAVTLLTISAAFIVGGFGFPVLIELYRRTPMRRWSLHARITILATVALLVVAPLLIGIFEWRNPATLGRLGTGDSVLGAWFQGATPRTAGFNTFDFGDAHEPTKLLTTALMFIGAGPASTSGGIKITTFAMLGYVLWTEIRGDTEVMLFRRRIPGTVIRQGVAVVLLAIGTVMVTAIGLLFLDHDIRVGDALFEAASAFGTVGLSTGITAGLPTLGHLLLVLVMLAGRVGPVTMATALALRHSPRLYNYPEERPIIG